MIQRKQSLWLFFAALLNSGVFYFDLYRTHFISHTTVNGGDTVVDTVGQLTVAEHYPSLLVAIVMTLLPLVAIFMYKQRKRQISMAVVSILAIISFIALLLSRVANLGKLPTQPTTGSYWIGAVLPVISLFFLFFAIGGIRRDEKLVKSVDRLR